MGENIYELFAQKLKGEITKDEFSKKYETLVLEDVHDINSEYLYGDI